MQFVPAILHDVGVSNIITWRHCVSQGCVIINILLADIGELLQLAKEDERNNNYYALNKIIYIEFQHGQKCSNRGENVLWKTPTNHY